MVSNHHYARVDTAALKDLICRRIGPQRAGMYVNQLKRYFSSKLSKVEFDKFCVRTIGRENLSLHNQLIRSIVKNACSSKVPPPKIGKGEGALNVKVTNGYQRNCLQSLYGDVIAPSPRKSRSPVNRDRKFRDRPSPLGPLGKTSSLTYEDSSTRLQSGTELHSPGSRLPVEDGEEVEQFATGPSIQTKSPLTAPYGVSLNMGSAQRAFRHGSEFRSGFHHETCENSGELPDFRSLRTRMEQMLQLEGLGISKDCVDLLNNGLNVYLKRLIEPSLRIAASRSGVEHAGYLDGRMSGLSRELPQNHMHRPRRSACASMLDFRVAMESDPQLLGEDWSIQLEKITSRAFEK